MAGTPHRPDPDAPPPPIELGGESPHIRIDLAAMPAALMMVVRLRRLQAVMKRAGRTDWAAEIDTILTEWECRK